MKWVVGILTVLLCGVIMTKFNMPTFTTPVKKMTNTTAVKVFGDREKALELFKRDGKRQLEIFRNLDSLNPMFQQPPRMVRYDDGSWLQIVSNFGHELITVYAVAKPVERRPDMMPRFLPAMEVFDRESLEHKGLIVACGGGWNPPYVHLSVEMKTPWYASAWRINEKEDPGELEKELLYVGYDIFGLNDGNVMVTEIPCNAHAEVKDVAYGHPPGMGTFESGFLVNDVKADFLPEMYADANAFYHHILYYPFSGYYDHIKPGYLSSFVDVKNGGCMFTLFKGSLDFLYDYWIFDQLGYPVYHGVVYESTHVFQNIIAKDEKVHIFFESPIKKYTAELYKIYDRGAPGFDQALPRFTSSTRYYKIGSSSVLLASADQVTGDDIQENFYDKVNDHKLYAWWFGSSDPIVDVTFKNVTKKTFDGIEFDCHKIPGFDDLISPGFVRLLEVTPL